MYYLVVFVCCSWRIWCAGAISCTKTCSTHSHKYHLTITSDLHVRFVSPLVVYLTFVAALSVRTLSSRLQFTGPILTAGVLLTLL